MKWEKKGLIYCPDENSPEWMDNSVLTPQPFLLTEDIIRVYGSFRDKDGAGRIGYVDVDAKNPSRILKISETPVLDIGENGCFDDNGMILGDVLRVHDKIYMYYVAFQLVKKAKFFAFSGLAISEDGGETFTRRGKAPVLDRSEEGIFGRCIHTVLFDQNKFRVWYSVIYDWTFINGIPYPTYDIKYIESENGVDFPKVGIQCLKCNENEYRIGRPRVRKLPNGKYEMRYTSDTYSKEYRSGYAESDDGIHWVRKDELSGLHPSGGTAWDSDEACYPVVCETKYGTYMFYDGNGMGKTGFGYAKRVEE